MTNKNIIISNININNIIYSFTEDNCNFTIFNSEYLICCGKIDIIICERRDMNLQLINLFNLTFPGKITNLTIHNYNDSFVKLLYNNKTSTDEHIYEYHIYPPKCKNENIILISYHSYTLNIDNLFEKKTNTNHYIILEQIPSYYGKIYVNGELIQQVGMKIKLNRKDNILYFISNNNLTVNNFEIKYNISIEETYSNLCTIFLTVRPCYPSCSNCSLSEEESNENSHNCIECAKGFFPFPENSSNCFNNNEMNDKNISYFFDPIKNAFSQCHSDCKTCNGSNENNCLSCRNETLFIYNGKCIAECPKKTSANRGNECQDCNINCETCLFPENSQLSSMNCLTCSEDKIIHEDDSSNHLKSCFVIHDNETKSFYNPNSLSNNISSCKQLFGKYIKENTNECIDLIPEGYYISNETTGLLSPCHPSCKTCSKNYTYNNTNCDTCKVGTLINGECVIVCEKGTYSYQGQCLKCHYNCLSCSGGIIRDNNGKMINMQCTECIHQLDSPKLIEEFHEHQIGRNLNNMYIQEILNQKPVMIQNEGNCFPVINYNMNKIKFNITEFDPETKVGTCLYFNKSIFFGEEICKTKPEKTFYVLNNNENTGVIKNCSNSCDYCLGDYSPGDTNCLNCSPGYYKTEDSDTNCILESLIEPNYYKNTSDNIYYKCHENCYNCTMGFNPLTNNMNCFSCKNGFYKLNGTDNCYNRTLLNESYYFEEDMLFHCDENCLTCSTGKDSISNNCLSCDINKGLYLIEKLNNCAYLNSSGYYLSANEDIQILKKCYHSCKSCNGGFSYNNLTKIENHNCIECKDNYYNLPNGLHYNNCYDNKTINSWILYEETYSKLVPTSYKEINKIDEESSISQMEYYIEKLEPNTNKIGSNITYIKNSSFELVFPELKTETSNESKIEPSLELNFSIEKSEFTTWKLGFTEEITYSEEGCHNSNLFLTPYGDCVSICPNDTFKFEPNNTCLKSCPKDYDINHQNECIKKIEYVTLSELKAQIIKNISTLINTVNSSKIINGSDFIAVIMPSDNTDPEAQLKNGISAIDLGNCTNVIKEYYNISPDENLYILNIESKRNETKKLGENNDKSFNLGKNMQIEIFDISGRKLNLSVCKQNIKIMKYIGDVDELNVQSAKNLAEQGIDVFNAKDDFFNDICLDYDNVDGKDIILKDRRTDIYKNVTFCQTGCLYRGINYELMAANCICDSSLIQSRSDNNSSNINKNNGEESLTFKSLTESFIANLFDFNLDVFKCYNLVFNLKVFDKNIGFYCMALMFLLQILFLFVFLIKRLTPLKYYMLIFNKREPKISISFPPRKNLKKKGEKKNIFLESDKSNEYNNIIGKPRLINSKNGNEYDLYCKSNNNIKVKNSKFCHIKNKEESNNSNSINNLIKKGEKGKLILENNFASIINIQTPIINIKNIKNIFNKKIAKEITKETLNHKNELYKAKFNKKKFLQNCKNKKSGSLYNIETIDEKNGRKNILRKNKDLIGLSKDDNDLQDMDYEQAIIYDNRTFFRIYWVYLIETQIILGTFCTENYLNLFVIKLSFLICTFQISFFLNAFFYTDEYISDAYHNNGVLDFFSGLPKSIYSLIATMIVTNLLNILFNNKRELANVIRKKREYKNYSNIVNNILKKLRNKLILYFIFVFVLGTLYLYYICSFCSVYRNSQKYWFIGCLQSFGMDSLIAIIICIFLAFFRYLSIKKQIKCFYILANIISNIL